MHRLPFACFHCTRRIASSLRPRNNAAFHSLPAASRSASSSRPSIPPHPRPRPRPHQLPHQLTTPRHHAYTTATATATATAPTSRARLRVAIIGSGPAGFYTAHRLLNKLDDAMVDMYEQLPVPYGLVRFGVAPDHPEVKNCQDTFEAVAQSPRFTYVGNVRVGHDVALAQLKPHYDAILFSYGADEDRQLGIPGEDLDGVFSARAFVGWYNGLPQFQHLKPNLQAGDTAVVIGQGNVALDVARILLSPVDALRHTDITEQALQTLADSKIRHVSVIGRRGPLQAAFTVKEARELMKIPPVAFHPIDRSFYPTEIKSLPRVQKRIADVLLKGSAADPATAPRTWALDFLKAPSSMNADATPGRLTSVTFNTQQFAPDSDPFDTGARVVATPETTTLPAALAFRSVGYKSTALRGLEDLGVPFDAKMGIIPNDIHGRVITPDLGPGNLTAGHLHGLYCAGWVKRGPTGVIASTMNDAFTSADVIAHDWMQGVPFLNDVQGGSGRETTGLGWDGVKDQVVRKGVRPLGWADWKRIDAAERARGQKVGKEREKFASVADMLQALDA